MLHCSPDNDSSMPGSLKSQGISYSSSILFSFSMATRFTNKIMKKFQVKFWTQKWNSVLLNKECSKNARKSIMKKTIYWGRKESHKHTKNIQLKF